MPLKLPRPFKSLSARLRAGSRHGASKTQTKDADTGAAGLPMTSWPGEGRDPATPGPETRHTQEFPGHRDPNSQRLAARPSDQAGDPGDRGSEQKPGTGRPDTCRQESSTSDYTSLTPASSVVSELPVHHGKSWTAAVRSLEHGLPDLLRPLDPGSLDDSLPTDPFPSTDSGLQDLQRKEALSASSSEKAAARPREEGAEESSCPPRSVRTGSGLGRASPRSPKDRSLVAEVDASSSTSRASSRGLDKGRRKDCAAATGPVSCSRSVRDGGLSRSSVSVPVSGMEMQDAEAVRAAQRSGAGSGSRVGSSMEAAGEAGCVDSEVFPKVALQTPVGALRKSRKRLCLMLNIEQPQIDTDWSPDYTGLADMLGFESLEIQNFWERNPADTLFMEWSRSKGSSLLPAVLVTLLQCLDRLGRQDIIMECRGLILEDVSDYLAEKRLLESYNVVRQQKFDCYVNIAEQDLLGVGRDILQNLEGVHELRLCLTLRDVTLGGFEYEEMAKMLETRCDSKVLIVLTKSYEDSDACQFLTQFAVTLDPGSRKSKLIPLLVDEDTSIPRVLRCLAMLNYRRDKRLGFLWPRLKDAIKTGPCPR